MAFSMDMSLFLEGSFLTEERLEKLQGVIHEAAPRWSSGLKVLEPGKPKRAIDITVSGSLAAAVVEVATARGPLYYELGRRSGIERRERRFGTAAMDGADRSLTVVVHIDDDLFSRAGPACMWGNGVSFQVRRQRVEGVDAVRWSRSSFEVACGALDIVWGNTETSEEYFSKNVFNEGGRVEAIGLDVSRALPGVYWLNYFGSTYCELIGRDRLLSAPAHEVKEVGAGVLLMVQPDPLAWETPEYREAERRVLEHLGPQYFFSRADPDRPTVAPPFEVPPPPDPSVRLQVIVR
jgi:hypothetical protein